MSTETPKALQAGHESLCEDLDYIISSGGTIGHKAQLLANLLRPHFKKEEEYALPPLSLLLTLAEGRWEFDKKEAIKMADKLQFELSQMQKEHAAITTVLQDLKESAEKEDNIKAKRFVKDLNLHVKVEDEVLYPATLLVGNYLKHTQQE